MLCLGACGSSGFGLGTFQGTTFTMIPPRLFQKMSHYVLLSMTAKLSKIFIELYRSIKERNITIQLAEQNVGGPDKLNV